MTLQKKHFIFLTTDFKPNFGGIAEYLHNLCNNLTKYIKVTVISTIAVKNKTWNYKYQLKIHDSSTKLVEKSRGQLLLNFHPQKQIIPFIKKLQNDEDIEEIKVFIGVWNPISHFWCKGLRKAGIKYAIFAYGKELLEPKFAKFTQQRQKDFLFATKIYGCSNATCQLTQTVIANNLDVETIYPGIETQDNNDNNNDLITAFKEQINIKPQQKIILSISRLVYRKGVDITLKAIASLINKYPNLIYIVAGDGEEKEKLQQITVDLGIVNHVKFLSSVSESTKKMLYEICDLFVLPTRESTEDWEGFGITFLEASMSGNPCIGGKTGGVKEAILDKHTGILVNTDDYNDTLNAIDLLLSNPNLRQEMGNNAIEYAQKFTWKNSALQLLKS